MYSAKFEIIKCATEYVMIKSAVLKCVQQKHIPHEMCNQLCGSAMQSAML